MTLQPAIDCRESIGPSFSAASMRHARTQSVDAVHRIAACVKPGMTTRQACQMANRILSDMGMERHWHPLILRFGEDTLKKFNESMNPERILREHDIFFVDIGPVWGGHEGDAGDTFVVGEDSEMQACAEAARVLWHEVAQQWRRENSTGLAVKIQ